MHLLFLDESGQLSERRFFALGGIALRDADWSALRDLWQATLTEHSWPAEREVKWHGIRRGEVPPALADAVVATLAHAPLTCYVTLLDVELGLETAPEFFASEEDTYSTGLMFLAERFQHLLAATDDVGMIVVDSRFREEDTRLRRFFSDLTKDGTPYSGLNRIVEGLFLGPSHYSIGLQCADLVVSITAAAERGNGQARGYLKQLLPRFAVHPAKGEVEAEALSRTGAETTRRVEALLTESTCLGVLRALEARESVEELPQELCLPLGLLAQRPQLRELALGKIGQLAEVFMLECH